MPTTETALEFTLSRHGVIMEPEKSQPHEAWGVLNPGGIQAGSGRKTAQCIFFRVLSPKGITHESGMRESASMA